MIDIYSVVGLAIVGAVLSLVLRQYRPEYSIVVALCTSVIILIAVLSAMQEIIDTVQNLLTRANIEGEFAQVLFKSLGICVVAQLAADACRDAGESAIATKVEMAGKVAVLVVSLPLFSELISISARLLSV